MKRIILAVMSGLLTTSLLAQWNPNSDNSCSGNLSIGAESNSISRIDIKSKSDNGLYFSFGNDIWSVIKSRKATDGSTDFGFIATTRDGYSEIITIKGNKNVGINTLDPTKTLDVNGSFRANEISISDFGYWNNSGISSNGTITTGTLDKNYNNIVMKCMNLNNLVYDFGNNTYSFIQSRKADDGSTEFGFSATTRDGYSEIVTIKGNKNVGINTLDPTKTLDVNGSFKANEINVSDFGHWNNSGLWSAKPLSVGTENSAGNMLELKAYNYNNLLFNMGNNLSSTIQSRNAGNGTTDLAFFTAPAPGQYGAEKMTIKGNGNIGINTANPTVTLDVNGTIRAKEVKIETTGWADFVFDKNYDLPSLNDVENHINAHKHLPNIPSEKEVKENGVDLMQMQVKLLQKIEELTLYSIQQNKRIEELEKMVLSK